MEPYTDGATTNGISDYVLIMTVFVKSNARLDIPWARCKCSPVPGREELAHPTRLWLPACENAITRNERPCIFTELCDI